MNNHKYIVGDVHGSIDAVKKILDIVKDDSIIWMGDYCDSRDYPFEDQINAIQLIFARKQDIFLLGNHDLHYLYRPDWHRCSQFQFNNRLIFQDKLLWVFDQLKFVYRYGGFILSHAGIHSEIIEYVLDNNINNLERINKLLDTPDKHDPTSLIYQCGPLRGGDGMPGIFWCDIEELLQDFQFNDKSIGNQIIGHNAYACFEDGIYIDEINGKKLLCVDSISSKDHKRKQFLKLYETGQYEIIDI